VKWVEYFLFGFLAIPLQMWNLFFGFTFLKGGIYFLASPFSKVDFLKGGLSQR
jgi:hypothetical protein